MEQNDSIKPQIKKEIESLVRKWEGVEGNLIMVLHGIQNRYGYIPRQVSFELQELMGVPLARIYEVITFYNFFKLESPGKHKISVCMGTACYLKGGEEILNELRNILHIEPGQTTRDGMFTIEPVRCIGCCGLAPVIMVDGKVYGKLKKDQVADIIAGYIREK